MRDTLRKEWSERFTYAPSARRIPRCGAAWRGCGSTVGLNSGRRSLICTSSATVSRSCDAPRRSSGRVSRLPRECGWSGDARDRRESRDWRRNCATGRAVGLVNRGELRGVRGCGDVGRHGGCLAPIIPRRRPRRSRKSTAEGEKEGLDGARTQATVTGGRNAPCPWPSSVNRCREHWERCYGGIPIRFGARAGRAAQTSFCAFRAIRWTGWGSPSGDIVTAPRDHGEDEEWKKKSGMPFVTRFAAWRTMSWRVQWRQSFASMLPVMALERPSGFCLTLA